MCEPTSQALALAAPRPGPWYAEGVLPSRGGWAAGLLAHRHRSGAPRALKSSAAGQSKHAGGDVRKHACLLAPGTCRSAHISHQCECCVVTLTHHGKTSWHRFAMWSPRCPVDSPARVGRTRVERWGGRAAEWAGESVRHTHLPVEVQRASKCFIVLGYSRRIARAVPDQPARQHTGGSPGNTRQPSCLDRRP